MIYASLDIETTGLEWENPMHMDKVLSIAIVIDNLKAPSPISDLPKLHLLIDPGGEITFSSPIAEQINRDLLSTLNKLRGSKIQMTYDPRVIEHYTTAEYALGIMFDFLRHHNVGKVDIDGVLRDFTVAGKNVMAFDVPFLNNYLMMDSMIVPHYRALDPAVLYLDPASDTKLPDTITCKARAGLNPEASHNALEDALDIVRLIRAAFKSSIQTSKNLPTFHEVFEHHLLTAVNA